MQFNILCCSIERRDGKFELDKIGHALLKFVSFQDTSGQGKRVRNPRGPAAVNGDETRRCHSRGREALFVKRDASGS